MESKGSCLDTQEKFGSTEDGKSTMDHHETSRENDETSMKKEAASKDQHDDNDEKLENNLEVGAENDEEIEEILSEAVKEERIKEAEEIKAKGNTEFLQGEFEKAVNFYTEAMTICPKVAKKSLAVLFGNRAACYVKMKENLPAIKDCTSALDLDQYYIKVRIRRAQAYEAEEKLEEAFEDYKKVLELDRTSKVAIEAVQRLPDQIKEKNEKLKEEMMGKLKDLGNMFLKPFGLSTDNFKLQQDPSTGGYTVNFQK